MDNELGRTQYNLSALCRYQQFGNSGSSKEDLVAASVGDRKPRTNFIMSDKEDTVLAGETSTRVSMAYETTSDQITAISKWENRTEGNACIGEGLQKFSRVNTLDLRERVVKLNPSDQRAELNQAIHKNNSKNGRGVAEAESELKRGRFNVKPS
jgi:hypothetical protein